jgi:hypothetical protein
LLSIVRLVHGFRLDMDLCSWMVHCKIK